MNFNKLLKSLFGDKSSRDMKLIQPLVEQVKAVYPEVQKLDNDALRQRTKTLQLQVQNSAQEQKKRIEELKATIENTPIDERADIFAQIDKIEKEVLEIYEGALNEVMPEVFAIVKETARRFAENEETVVTATDFDRELAADPKKDFITIDGDKAIYHNHWTAGGNDLKWEMVHYDVQLFGGVVLGTIAGMLYRMIFHVWFTGKIIRNRKQLIFFKKLLIFAITTVFGVLICRAIPISIEGIASWILCAGLYFIVLFILYAGLSMVVFRGEVDYIYHYLKNR